ncbi:family 43 glycosylhydrolase [Pedobacter sp. SD-b]|uniref:Family 43 glycosylhydrolase n=1 Tax=Pedobacter segetis TaxID=2793069 RepID=A0ABS1BJV2_9SPHI|nr:family 43 glycosylhydrolase [Pedobacter segetis]MBK0383078.1 family 43 glycosylhydrolase [Pedobacter segetis]
MNFKSFFRFFALFIIVLTFTRCSKKKIEIPTLPPVTGSSQTDIYPYKEWEDTDGKPINAHSAGVYFENGFYYWLGESKLNFNENTSFADGGVAVYKSKDLINWQNMGLVLSVDYNNSQSDISYGCRIQRPKVVYNASTKKYVMIFKLFLKGGGVELGYNGVATADKITGPFTYVSKFIAASPVNGSGDFALYQAPNGDLYHFTVRKSDRVFVKAKMSDDYLSPATAYVPCPGIASNTEGPAIFYKDGIYHLLASGSSGWDPNPARYYTSNSIDGPWTNGGNPCVGTNPLSGFGPEKTFGGQPTFILKVEGADNQYIALCDVWRPTTPTKSTYIWLPFRVKNNKFILTWLDKWNLTWFNNN